MPSFCVFKWYIIRYKYTDNNNNNSSNNSNIKTESDIHLQTWPEGARTEKETRWRSPGGAFVSCVFFDLFRIFDCQMNGTCEITARLIPAI